VQARDPVIGAQRESSQFRLRSDVTFIKGYSDVREQMEDAIRRGERPTKGLRHRMQWVTIQRPNGRPDLQKATQFRVMGYQPMKWDEMDGLGYEVPIAAFKTPDGGVQIGDTQLYYCDAATAEQHMIDGRAAIDAQTAVDATSSTLHQAGRDASRGVGDELTTATLEQRHEVGG